MTHKRQLGIVALLVLSLFLQWNTAMAQNKKKGNGKQSNSAALKHTLEGEDVFIQAQKALILQHYEEAKTLFNRCVELDAKNDAAYYELSRIAYDERQTAEALRYIEKAVKLDPDNKWYQLMYADVLGIVGSMDKSEEVYQALIKKDPDNPEYYYDLAYTLKFKNDAAGALKVFDKLEQLMGIDENITLEKQRIYMELEQPEKAIEEMQKLIEKYPHREKYYLLLAELYVVMNQKDKAIEAYRKILEFNPNHPMARLAMAEHHLDNGDSEQYMQELRGFFSNPAVGLHGKVEVLLAKYGDYASKKGTPAFDEVLELSKIMIDTHPEDAEANAIRADILFYGGEKEASIPLYQKSTRLDGSNYLVWQQLFYVLADLNKHQDLADNTQAAIDLFPNQPLPYFFNGLANNHLNNYEKAVKSLKKASFIATDNTNLLTEIYAQLGDIYNTTREYKKSDESYEESLRLDPNNAYVLNNYSYYLSVRNENLDKAEEMSKKSNEIEPDNISFLDTYAWIMFQQQKYADAATWIEKALAQGGDKRPVIVEHAGDIYFRLGNVNKAVEMWIKSKELGNKNPELDKKIAEKRF